MADKFYKLNKFAILFLAAVLLTVNATFAQCPTGTATSMNLNGHCYVMVYDFPPGSTFLVIDASNNILAAAPVNAAGEGSTPYPCNPAAAKVRTIDGSCSINIVNTINLPVKLVNFTGNITEAGTVSLQWTTAAEVNSAQYIVEKSKDGSNFTAIATIDAAKNSNVRINYNHADAAKLEGVVYYRLRMVDVDGHTEMSNTIALNSKSTTTAVNIFPNPFNDKIQILGLPTNEINRNNIAIFTLSGRVVPFKINAGTILFDESVNAGVYILKVKEVPYKVVKL
jgi:hypothetical protein